MVDVFGNVNYGIMMASYGVGKDEALLASRQGSPTSGVSDDLDDEAISLGYEFYARYPNGVPESASREDILSKLSSPNPW